MDLTCQHVLKVKEKQMAEAAAAAAELEATRTAELFRAAATLDIQQKMPQFVSIYHVLDTGRPMVAYKQLMPVLQLLDTPNCHYMHNTDSCLASLFTNSCL